VVFVFAEFEREIVRKRVNSGLDRVRGEIDRKGVYATKNGHTIKRLGRPVQSRRRPRKRRRCWRLATVS
jgi:DNA invertase Pin-like site-specific DNA recombinase